MNRLTNSDLISASYSPWELCGLDKDCLRSCEECNIGVSGVLAWRELPEPWEGEK